MPPAADSTESLTTAAKRIAAADRDGQLHALTQLARWAIRPMAAMNAFNALLATGNDGPRLALEFIARIPGEVPHSLVLVAAPILSNPKVPIPVKLAAAARFVAVLPDKPEAVGPVLRVVTAGLKKGKALNRLLALQSRVETCEALDAAVAVMELKVRLKCPLCSKSFSRPGLIKHLWKKHRTEYQHGKLISPSQSAESIVSQAKSDDPTTLDRAFLHTPALFPETSRIQILQGLSSRHFRSSDQYATLADRAGDSFSGLCPKCYASVPDAVPEMPSPLTLSHGRLSGEGFHIAVNDRKWGRTIRIERPGGERTDRTDDLGKRSPRMAGVIFATPIAIFALIAACFLPPFKPGAGWTAVWLSVVAVLLYAAVYAFRRNLPEANGRAVDTAWSDLVPGIGRSKAAARFLARLCRASLTAGDPGERSQTVWELADHAAVLSEKSGPFVSFFATATILRSVDAGNIGRDVVAELVADFTNVFQRSIAAPVAEQMAELVSGDVALSVGDRMRLTVLLAAAAFDSGLTPADLPALRRHMPRIVGLLPSDADYLRLLYTVWQLKPSKPWDRAAECEPIFTLAKQRPTVAIRALRADPDAVLVHQPEEFLNDILGPVTVSRRGVSFGGATVSDPQADVTVVTTKDGGEITFGKSVFSLARRPNEKIERTLKKLLTFRIDTLIAQMESTLNDDPTGRAELLLAPLNVPCPLCRTVSVIRTGQLGVVLG